MIHQKSPKFLKIWFIIHFFTDLIFAVPLFLFPVDFLQLLDWHTIDPLATRIVAAALLAIGIESFLGRNASVETYKNMLNLKIIWSAAVVAGVSISIYQSSYSTTIFEWLLLLIFLLFNIIWVYWRIRLRIHK